MDERARHPAGSHPTVTDNLPAEWQPDDVQDGDPGWTGDSAIALLLANTATGQTVLDLDDDRTLRAAAATTGRRYHLLPPELLTSSAVDACSSRHVTEPGADLVTIRWPRPDATAHPRNAWTLLTVVKQRLADTGHVAVLLAPTRLQPFTVTWTGALLTAAARAGLNYLQDIVCLHEPPDEHRVVLVLRRRAGRHAH